MADLRSAPSDVQTLMLAATNAWFVTLDNVSTVGPWLSDALCRVSTGGGLGTRCLYTNDEEALFDCQRPVMVTGITELTSREDFLDRCVIIRCPEMPESERRDERRFYSAFNSARPQILGALLTAAAGALRELPRIRLARLPRMADFALWSTAAENALGWKDGTFIAAYLRNQDEANEMTLGNPVADAICKLLDPNTDIADAGLSKQADAISWKGAATPLLSVLSISLGPSIRETNDWPRSGAALTSTIKRMTVNLRKAGIVAVHDGRRTWTLSKQLAA